MVILYRYHIRKSHSNLPPAREHPLQLQSRLLLRRPLQVKRPSCFDLEKWRREGREGVHMVKGAQLPQIQPDSLRYLSEENTALPRPIFSPRHRLSGPRPASPPLSQVWNISSATTSCIWAILALHDPYGSSETVSSRAQCWHDLLWLVLKHDWFQSLYGSLPATLGAFLVSVKFKHIQTSPSRGFCFAHADETLTLFSFHGISGQFG